MQPGHKKVVKLKKKKTANNLKSKIQGMTINQKAYLSILYDSMLRRITITCSITMQLNHTLVPMQSGDMCI